MFWLIAEAGTGGLGLAIEGPSEAVVSCKDNCDGSCSVEYVPTEPGDYDISIKFADKHIPGSPFKVMAEKQVHLILKIGVHKFTILSFYFSIVSKTSQKEKFLFLILLSSLFGDITVYQVPKSDNSFENEMFNLNYCLKFPRLI